MNGALDQATQSRRRSARDLALRCAGQPRAADRLLDRIEAQCRLLADNPRLGRVRPEIAPDARAWVFGRYLVLYREQEDGIELVRVVHGARRVEQVEF